MKNKFLKSAAVIKAQFVLLLLLCVSLTSRADNKLLESVVKYEHLIKCLTLIKRGLIILRIQIEPDGLRM